MGNTRLLRRFAPRRDRLGGVTANLACSFGEAVSLFTQRVSLRGRMFVWRSSLSFRMLGLLRFALRRDILGDVTER